VTTVNSRHPLYSVWANMHRRCCNPKDPSFKNYGARGIVVCDRWSSLDAFISDMGERPDNDHTLDRTNNDLGYSPDNCRWASRSEQCFNRRTFANNTTGVRGVVKSGASWVARLDYERIRYVIGWFETKQQAEHARSVFVDLFFLDKEAAIATLPKDEARFTSSTGVRGITPHVDGGFTVRVTVNGKRHYLGFFQTMEEGCAARDVFLKARDASSNLPSNDKTEARRNSKTGISGINQTSKGFVVRMTDNNGLRKYAGTYKTLEDASNARQEFLASQVG
jgi:hypothetical protein